MSMSVSSLLVLGVALLQPGLVCFAAVLRGIVDAIDRSVEASDAPDSPEAWLHVAEAASSDRDTGTDKLARFYRSVNSSRVLPDANADEFGSGSDRSIFAAEEGTNSSESMLDAAHLVVSSSASAAESTAVTGLAASDGSLPLSRTSQGWYAVEVEIGGAPVLLAVDTGSSYLWHRPRAANASGARLSPGDAPMQHFSAQYGRGAVAGDIYDETVIFGDQPLSCAVGSATDLSAFWARQSSVDGVLGLGCSSLAPAGALDCAWRWDRKVFTLSMDQDGGKLILGSVPAEYEPSLVYLPAVDDCGHWTAPLLGLAAARAGERPQSALLAGPRHTAVLDSGSDGIVGPAGQMAELVSQMGGTPEKAGEGYDASVRFFTVPCELSLPDVEITLATADETETSRASVRISGDDFTSEEAKKSGQARCRLRLVGWEKTEEWILGRIFLTRIQAAVFEIDRRRVGLAL